MRICAPRMVTTWAVAVVTALMVFAAPTAQARPPDQGPLGDAPTAQTVTNSPRGFIGCTSSSAVRAPRYWIYCFAVDEPSAGGEAGLLSTDAWACSYSGTSGGNQRLQAPHTVLPRSSLRVRSDGSFTFSARIPVIGRVSIVGGGGGHEVYDAPLTWYSGPTGYMPQGYSLVSPRRGLTMYGIFYTFQGDINPTRQGRTAYFFVARVNGTYQDALVGDVWSAPASGEWASLSC